jgi:hypothetical protein
MGPTARYAAVTTQRAVIPPRHRSFQPPNSSYPNRNIAARKMPKMTIFIALPTYIDFLLCGGRRW